MNRVTWAVQRDFSKIDKSKLATGSKQFTLYRGYFQVLLVAFIGDRFEVDNFILKSLVPKFEPG